MAVTVCHTDEGSSYLQGDGLEPQASWVSASKGAVTVCLRRQDAPRHNYRATLTVTSQDRSTESLRDQYAVALYRAFQRCVAQAADKHPTPRLPLQEAVAWARSLPEALL